MKLSEMCKAAIYGAIHEQITQARLQIARQPSIAATKTGESIDFRLAQLVGPIFRDVVVAIEQELKPKKGKHVRK